MNYYPLSDNTARQAIDSFALFEEFLRARKSARAYAGGMYWKQQGEYTYLVRTYLDNRQQRIGKRSAETEGILKAFTAAKAEAEERLKSLTETLAEAERLNKALKVGRVPNIVVSVLQVLEGAGLSEHFTVVGTHALYAYETAAGVRIAQAALATQDVDLLWDARKRVRFLAEMEKLDTSILGILRKVDRTFQRKEDQSETAINAKGFEIDFLRRQPEGDDVHPFRFSDDEDDLWPVQARRANVLTQAARFEQVVVSVTGKMATMRTIDPRVFVEFKTWMSKEATRPNIKRSRDARQAEIVKKLLDEGSLIPTT